MEAGEQILVSWVGGGFLLRWMANLQALREAEELEIARAVEHEAMSALRRDAEFSRQEAELEALAATLE